MTNNSDPHDRQDDLLDRAIEAARRQTVPQDARQRVLQAALSCTSPSYAAPTEPPPARPRSQGGAPAAQPLGDLREPRSRRQSKTYAVLTVLAGIAASIALAIFIPFGGAERALAWDEVVAKMIAADSVDCKSYAIPKEGGKMLVWDFQYDKRRGYDERYYDNQGLQESRVDDGVNHWFYRRFEHVAVRDASLSATSQLDRLLHPIGPGHKLSRDPKGDVSIEGDLCRHYQGMSKPPFPGRYDLWIDSRGRLRRSTCEMPSPDGQWVPVYQTEAVYQVKFPPEKFQPSFGEEVKIVDLAGLVREKFPPERVLARRTKDPYEVCVHSLKRLNDLDFLAVVSYRPSERARRSPDHPPQNLPWGQWTYQIQPESLDPQIVQQTSRQISMIRAGDVAITAVIYRHHFNLAQPPAARPTRVDRARFRVGILKMFNLPGEVLPVCDFDLPLPSQPTNTEAAVREVYETVSLFDPLPVAEAAIVSKHRPTGEELERRAARLGRGITLKESKLPESPNTLGNVPVSEVSFDRFLSELKTVLGAE